MAATVNLHLRSLMFLIAVTANMHDRATFEKQAMQHSEKQSTLRKRFACVSSQVPGTLKPCKFLATRESRFRMKGLERVIV